jgi:glycosyltransferase involved in cell wall biosynthesis
MDRGASGPVDQPLSTAARLEDGEGLPVVSVIIPCRNEEEFIGPCLESIVQSSYPQGRTEVLVVDGRSRDMTRSIVEGYARRNPRIRLLDNPRGIIPAAMNVGIRNATGEVIVKMDAHSTYDRDYIATCVKHLLGFGADGVGGVLVTVPMKDTIVARAVARAVSHPFGAGNSYFRIGSRVPRWVDAAAFGCYRREVFDNVGVYNEALVRSSDSDLNRRLTRAGGRILLVPTAVIYYYASSYSFGGFWKHNFSDGLWVVYPLKFGARVFSWRHLVPLAFVFSVMSIGALSLFSTIFLWSLLVLLGSYGVASGLSAIHVAGKEGSWRLLFLMPLAFAVRHVAYGLGSLVGLLRVLMPGRKGQR